MGKNVKTVFKGFSYRNCDDFAAYLSDMAAKGWHFREWSAGLVFQKGEPEKAEYAVEVFSGGTEYDTRPEPNTQEFAEYCHAAGWKLIDAKRKFCIFKKISPDAVPILTPEERINSTVKAMGFNIWWPVNFGACNVLIELFSFSGTSFPGHIFSNSRLVELGFWMYFFFSAALHCAMFYLWQHKAKEASKRGEPVYLGRKNKRSILQSGWYECFRIVLFVMLTLWCLCTKQYIALAAALIIFTILFGIGYLVGKYRPDPVSNQIIQTCGGLFAVFVMFLILLYASVSNNQELTTHPEVPFVCEDIGWEAGELKHISDTRDSSIFGSFAYTVLFYDEKDVFYHVYQSEHDWILDKIWDDRLDKRYNQNVTDCTQDWNAQIAYYNNLDEYFARYDDAIIVFNGPKGWTLTSEQIAFIREMLLEGQVHHGS